MGSPQLCTSSSTPWGSPRTRMCTGVSGVLYLSALPTRLPTTCANRSASQGPRAFPPCSNRSSRSGCVACNSSTDARTTACRSTGLRSIPTPPPAPQTCLGEVEQTPHHAHRALRARLEPGQGVDGACVQIFPAQEQLHAQEDGAQGIAQVMADDADELLFEAPAGALLLGQPLGFPSREDRLRHLRGHGDDALDGARLVAQGLVDEIEVHVLGHLPGNAYQLCGNLRAHEGHAGPHHLVEDCVEPLTLEFWHCVHE